MFVELLKRAGFHEIVLLRPQSCKIFVQNLQELVVEERTFYENKSTYFMKRKNGRV